MEGKWTSDLTTVLRSHKLLPVTVSCKGDDAAFGVYQHALANQFTQNPVVWKRTGKAFPYRLTFPLKFVQFDESLCWNPAGSNIQAFAYLHVFFISSSSVDEYKASVRHLVSEWFALVSTTPDVQWLIVVDSTKAKERKGRSPLMEKLKSDFSKYQSRVIEVSESVEHGSFSSLVQSVQSAVFLHLEALTSTWENRLAIARDQYLEEDWSFVGYFESVINLARFYWSLGALEHSLSIYDELDRFISTIVLEAAESGDNPNPNWISKFRKSESPVCPTLRNTFSSSGDTVIHSYLDVRHALLAQQVLLSLHMYYLRSRSRGAAPSLRVDFAAVILKYAQHCQMAVYEHTKLLAFAIPLPRLATWTIFLVGDALNVCGLLADPSTISAATSALCHLHLERFNAMMSFCDGEFPKDAGLVDWLKGSRLEGGNVLIEAIEDPSVFSAQLQKIHDTTSSILMQSSRSRLASYIGWRLAKWMTENNREEVALPYKLRHLTRLLENGFRSPVTMQILKEVLPQLSPQQDRERILFYHLLLSLHSSEDKERVYHAAEFIHLLSQGSHKPLQLSDLSPKPPTIFEATVVDYSKRVHIPLDRLSIEIEVINHLPVPLPVSSATVTISSIDEGFLNRKADLVFELTYNESEQVCRMLLPYYHRARGSVSHISPPLALLPHSTVSLTLKDTLLQPGKNRLSFSTEMRQKGCFVVDKLDLAMVGGGLLTGFDHWAERKDPVLMFVGSNPHKVWVEEGRDFLAGVVQSVDLFLEAGCTMEPSELFVCAGGEEHIEFLSPSGSWSSEVKLPVSALQHQEKSKVSVPVYVRMDGNMTDGPAVRKVKLNVEWCDKSCVVELRFVALFFTSTRTTLLETQNLLEVELARALADEYTVVMKVARLEIPSNDGAPAMLAKLLNPEMQELAPNTVANLVFILPLDGEVPISHVLSLDYRVKSSNGDILEHDRLFTYSMQLDMRVRKVGYEICTQMLSQMPGAQLCRAHAPCDLVVSLRSLMHNVELLYIVLDADSHLWTLNERAKVLQVKESGLGQIVFSVVPCTAGFLPYPSISVYSCVSVGPRSLDGAWNEGVDVLPGSPLVSFHRTAGKQIRVLGASQKSLKVGEKREGFKEKFVKLFD